jgi:hypothetical protein
VAADAPSRTDERSKSFVVPSAEGRRALLKGVRTREEIERATKKFADAAREYAKRHRSGGPR